MSSIYDFFANLIGSKGILVTVNEIRPDHFDTKLFLSYSSRDDVSDIVLRLKHGANEAEGGELIELKDSDSYTVAPFNSSIPVGKKALAEILSPHLEGLEEDLSVSRLRNMFYLIRGRQEGKVKVCLVHGSFFESISPSELIRGGVQQLLNEVLPDGISRETRVSLLEALVQGEFFSRTHHVEGASIFVRFDFVTEANPAGNILQYPEIEDNTLSFVVPSHSLEQDANERKRLSRALSQAEYDQLIPKRIKHPFNGEFQVFQIPLV